MLKSTKTPQKQLRSWTGQQINGGQHAVNAAKDHHDSRWEINILTPAWLTPSTHLSKCEGPFTFITLGILHNSHHQTPYIRLVTPGPARTRRVRDTEMPQQLFPPSLLKQFAPPPGRLQLSNPLVQAIFPCSRSFLPHRRKCTSKQERERESYKAEKRRLQQNLF